MRSAGTEGSRASGVIRSIMAALVAVSGVFVAASATAQQAGVRALSIEQALRLAEDASEQVAIARAGVMRSTGELRRARSEYFPQVNASASYTRTLASEFSSIGGDGAEPDTTSNGSSEPCGTFMPDPALPLQARVDSLEAAVRCQSLENPFAAFADLPFGRENQWRLDLSVSQVVFSGGRVQAQSRVASAGRRVAEMGLTSARAQLVLDVASAYYDAALADRLFSVAQATLEQAESTLRQVRLGRDVGNQPEFELLRAQVTRDTQEPLVIQRRADRDIAFLRLKQLLNLPAEATVDLTTALDGEDAASVVQVALDVVGVEADTAVDGRVVVRQAAESVRVQEAQSAIARAGRLPSLSLSMQYGRVGYPTDFGPFDADFRTNWSVGATVQVPIFTGFRLSGDRMIAQANLEEARARLSMTRETAALDARDATQRLEAARASWSASTGTVEQADRAYEIAQVRFSEGISTQLELNDSRLLLQQSQANRAMAARNLRIARLRVALLPYLPLGAGAQTLDAATATQQQIAPQQTTPSRQGSVVTQANSGATGAVRN